MQDIRFPTFCIFKFESHVVKPFSRKIRLYDRGNYCEFRQKVSESNSWNTLYNGKVNLNAKQFSDNLLSIAEQSIPWKQHPKTNEKKGSPFQKVQK